MLFDNYSTKTAEASLDSLWVKTQVIANNMANVDTPGFKASNVTFEEVLNREAANRKGSKANPDNFVTDVNRGSREDGEAAARTSQFQSVVTQDTWTTVRIDGNNVQLEREQAELWKTYAQYSYLLDRVSGHYKNISSAINTMRG